MRRRSNRTDTAKRTIYVIRTPGHWIQIPRLTTYRNPQSEHNGAPVWSSGEYQRGEYSTVSRKRYAPPEATVCFPHETPNICDLDWRISHRQTEDRKALQCIAYCLTNRITPVRYYAETVGTPYQRGDENIDGVPRVVHEAWNQLPAGVRAFADKPARI